MARLVVLTDRYPDDTDWKGAFIWKLILSLAESQHEILAIVTEDPKRIPFTHPRLTIVRPAEQWRADQLPKLARSLLQFRPEILHTFALRSPKLWSPLTVWPYLDAMLAAFPQVRRCLTLLDAEDFDPRNSTTVWYQGAEAITVFTSDHARKTKAAFPTIRVEQAPLDLEIPAYRSQQNSDEVLIPAPISEWTSPDRDLSELVAELSRKPELQIKIIGGWGDRPSSEQRRGWKALAAVAGQVQMLEPQCWQGFLELASKSRSLRLRGLKQDSWRTLVAHHVADSLGKEIDGPLLKNLRGSTANFISRLYALNC
jgi:hypothetical protein